MAAFFVVMTETVTAHRLARAITAAALLACAQTAASQHPAEIALTQRLADARAARLVLDRTERLQPADRGAPGWSDWEKLRCSALARLELHAALVQRASALPKDAPVAVAAACHTGAAQAALALGEPAQ